MWGQPPPAVRPGKARRLRATISQLSVLTELQTVCHAERSSEESEAILTAESKHPYIQTTPSESHRSPSKIYPWKSV